MKWQIIILPIAEKLLAEISDRRVRESIARRIDRLGYEPDKQGKPMRDELIGFRSIRAVGQRYRIIYKVDGETVTVLVVVLGIRKEGDKKDVYEHEVEVYKQRGADFIVRSVMDVVECLPGGLTLAGRWNDLDWDQMEEGLHRNRHESQPTPSIDMD